MNQVSAALNGLLVGLLFETTGDIIKCVLSPQCRNDTPASRNKKTGDDEQPAERFLACHRGLTNQPHHFDKLTDERTI
jgi:hypothetical protein